MDKDIKTLYTDAKRLSTKHKTAEYNEYVQYLLENKPLEYLSGLEYIISSSTGLSTWPKFMEKYGITVMDYDAICQVFEKVKSKSKSTGKKEYNKDLEDSMSDLINIGESFANHFIVYEAADIPLDDEYRRYYYGKRNTLVGNISNLFSRYGESVIPDMLIEANRTNTLEPALRVLSEAAYDILTYTKVNSMASELSELKKDVKSIRELAQKIYDKSLSGVVDKVKTKAQTAIKEAVMLGNTVPTVEYTEAEVNAIKELILYKEYYLTCLENGDTISRVQKEIYDLYTEFGDLLEENESSAVIAQDFLAPARMHPYVVQKQEAFVGQKKMGAVPGYLAKRHNLGYGEDDETDDGRPEGDEDSSLDDFKRSPDVDTTSDGTPTDELMTPEEVKADDTMSAEEQKQAITNYYYYTYNNSFNKSQKTVKTDDHSIKVDDHSRHAKTIDQSRRADDHSVGKRIHSDNIGTNEPEEKNESAPWELDIFAGLPSSPFDEIFTESQLFKEYHSDLKSFTESISEFPADVLTEGKMWDWIKSRLRQLAGFINRLFGTVIPKSLLRTKDILTRYRNSKQILSMVKEAGDELEIHRIKAISFKDISVLRSYLQDFLDKKIDYRGEVEKLPSLDRAKLDYNIQEKTVVLYFGVPTDKLQENLFGNRDKNLNFFLKSKTPFFGRSDKVLELTHDNTFDEKSILSGLYGMDKNDIDKLIELIQKVVDTITQDDMPKDDHVFVDPADGKRKQRWAADTVIPELQEYQEFLRSLIAHLSNTAASAAKFTTESIAAMESFYQQNHIETVQAQDVEQMMGVAESGETLVSIYEGTDEQICSYFLDGITQTITEGLFSKTPEEKALGQMKKNIEAIIAEAIKKIRPVIKKNVSEANKGRGLFSRIQYPQVAAKIGDRSGPNAVFGITKGQLRKNLVEIIQGPKKTSKGIILWITTTISSQSRTAENTAFNLYRSSIKEALSGMQEAGKISFQERDSANYTVSLTYSNMPIFIKNEAILKGVNVDDLKTRSLEEYVNFNQPSLELFSEGDDERPVGDADDNKPKSDHPIRDTLMDVDKHLAKGQQAAKKKVQELQNVGRTFVKPAKRTSQWVTNMVGRWKDKNENDAKAAMSDPHERSALFKALRTAIVGGSLWKAGLLTNPIFMTLAVLKKGTDFKNRTRLRNEMIGELKTEMEIIDVKIQDADRNNDNKAKYQLMRFKNEINKKLLRVSGGKRVSKIL